MRKNRLKSRLWEYESRLGAQNWEWLSASDGLCNLIIELCDDYLITREEYYRGLVYIKRCLEPYRDYRYNRSFLEPSEREKAFHYLKEALLKGSFRSQASIMQPFNNLLRQIKSFFTKKLK